jgi:hypothetical protein
MGGYLRAEGSPHKQRRERQMEQLTGHDYDLLIEALDCWEASPHSSAMIGSIMSTLVIKDKEASEKFIEKQMSETSLKVKSRKEQSILLKAKLLKMKDAVEIESL